MLTTSGSVDYGERPPADAAPPEPALRKELGPLGITGGQAALLWAIRSKPEIGVRELAELEGVSPPAMTTTSIGSRPPGWSARLARSMTGAASSWR